MSGSLLFIAVVWIVLLAPLLLRNQSPVRRTAKALTETRVLHEGGSSLQPKRRLKPAESLYQASDDDDLELVDAEPEFFLIDDAGESLKTLKTRTRKFGRKRKETEEQKSEEMVGSAKKPENKATSSEDVSEEVIETVDAEIVSEEAGGDSAASDGLFTSGNDVKAQPNEAHAEEPHTIADTIDGEVVDEDSTDETSEVTSEVTDGAEQREQASGTVRAEDSTNGDEDHTKADEEAQAEEDHDDEDPEQVQGQTNAAELSPMRLVVDSDVDDQAEGDTTAESDGEILGSRHTEIPVAYFRGSDLDASAEIEDIERGVEQGEKEAAAAEIALAEDRRLSAEYSRDELDDEDMRYLESRRGRGVYDPVASKAAAERRLKRRKQVLAVLVGLCVISLITGILAGGLMWLAPVLAVGMTALYLYFLRVNAVEEARMRQRRIARMRRARLGVRNTEDQELGIPDRLRRPGAVIVESDDSDPEFEHLEYIHGSDYFDDYDHDGGQGSHASHTRIRAV
ncbi:gephyrin-like molybdotransferase receptor GlpR [Corynebacterium anserum]|uniref:Uncharacterized protein n=1 Tax=Corynebacterium anserum TaxID=2684406 RepID=A0A7G7YPI1_9CORY|nr:gephyrin-like molybdotransferase receptor GlpR [Corynebacterium anserum]MBC2682030.1 hypothetical protein [Corynebacterium anserum]QNH96401.1 hypothetical protein GP473_06805 [Corynebacterium anserum]